MNRRAVLAGAGACVALAAARSGRAAVPPIPRLATRRFAIAIGPGVVRYGTEAGETLLTDAAGAPLATVFGVSYVAETGGGVDRPVTFVFNGGPGGASWPLHTTLSPKQIVRAPTRQGYAITPNVDSPIDQTDLVFVDAPGTGFSRMLSESAKDAFWGIEQDADAITRYIGDWLRRHRRDASPVYLLGESYGGTRIAQILRILSPGARRRFGGVVLVSPTLGANAPLLDGMDLNVSSLPTLAASSRWYGCGAYTAAPVDVVWQRAADFAGGGYARALALGGALPPSDAAAIAAQLAAFTGVEPDILLRSGLRMPIERYRDLLLAAQGERLRLVDAREHVPVPPPGGTVSVIQTADGYDLQAAILDLLRNELGYDSTEPYRRDPEVIGKRWNNRLTAAPWKLTEVLRATAAADPAFGILLLGGYYDLVVPHFGTQIAFRDAALPTARFRDIVYPAGHAVFSDPVVRPLAADDLRAFYRSGHEARRR